MKIIVTGSSKGIGRGIATHLATAGHAIGLLARDEGALRELQLALPGGAGRHAVAPCDLQDPAATETAIQDLIRQLDGVDVLINNAGLVIRKDCFSLSLDEWHALVNTNINGLFYATRAALSPMKVQGAGHIINISSISGKVPLPGGSAYAATKFAVTGFSQSLLQEVRDYGIKVTVVYPGSVDSESHRDGSGGDHGWKVTPDEVGQVCADALAMRPGACVSEIEIRPLMRAPKK